MTHLFFFCPRGTNNGQVDHEHSHTFTCPQDSFNGSQMNNPSIILATSTYTNDKVCPRNSCHHFIDHHCSNENCKRDHCDHHHQHHQHRQHRVLHSTGNHSCVKNINYNVEACNHQHTNNSFSPSIYDDCLNERTNNSRTNEQHAHSFHNHHHHHLNTDDHHHHHYHLRQSSTGHHESNLYRSNSSEFISQHMRTLPLTTLAASTSSKLGMSLCAYLCYVFVSLLLFPEHT